MSHTNSTTNYGLPQFIATDKPAWLTDVNPAYLAIDTAIDAAKDAADAAQNDATQALTDAGAAATTASNADTKAAGAVASIAQTFADTNTYSEGDLVIYNNLLYKCIADVTTPGPWTGVANWDRAYLGDIVEDNTADIASNAGAISTLTSAVAGKATLMQETISATTSGSGLINTGKKTGSLQYVLSCTPVTTYGGYYCTMSLTTSGEWYCNVKSVNDNSSINNTMVSVKIVYWQS